MRRVCVFDVNETLLDLSGLDPEFELAFGDASVRREWFGQMIESALVATVTDAYVAFGRIGAAALRMIAERRGVALSHHDETRILGGIRQLPPHPDVEPALRRLRDAGYRTATLTNSTQEVAEVQLANTGLTDLFERVLSADSVRRLKPAPEPYLMAAEQLGVPISDVRLIAAHSWDVAGALRAGAAAAFVARQGKVLDPLVEPKPDVIGRDLAEVVDKIVALGR